MAAATQKIIGNQSLKALGNYLNTVSLSSAKTLAQVIGTSIPAGANAAKIQAETQNVRMTDDGVTTPVAGTTGILILAGLPAEWYVGDLSALQFVEDTASGKLNISLYNIS
jgi:hypothetical protein